MIRLSEIARQWARDMQRIKKLKFVSKYFPAISCRYAIIFFAKYFHIKYFQLVNFPKLLHIFPLSLSFSQFVLLMHLELHFSFVQLKKWLKKSLHSHECYLVKMPSCSLASEMCEKKQFFFNSWIFPISPQNMFTNYPRHCTK